MRRSPRASRGRQQMELPEFTKRVRTRRLRRCFSMSSDLRQRSRSGRQRSYWRPSMRLPHSRRLWGFYTNVIHRRGGIAGTFLSSEACPSIRIVIEGQLLTYLRRHGFSFVQTAEVFPLILSLGITIQGIIFAVAQSTGLDDLLSRGCTLVSQFMLPGMIHRFLMRQ